MYGGVTEDVNDLRGDDDLGGGGGSDRDGAHDK